MQENKSKAPLRRSDVAATVMLLVIAFFTVYFISFVLLLDCGHFPFIPEWFWGQIGLYVVVGYSFAWIFMMRVLIKNIKIRIALILVELAIVAAILTWWIIENSSICINMFG